MVNQQHWPCFIPVEYALLHCGQLGRNFHIGGCIRGEAVNSALQTLAELNSQWEIWRMLQRARSSCIAHSFRLELISCNVNNCSWLLNSSFDFKWHLVPSSYPRWVTVQEWFRWMPIITNVHPMKWCPTNNSSMTNVSYNVWWIYFNFPSAVPSLPRLQPGHLASHVHRWYTPI